MIDPYTTPIPDHNLIEPSQEDENYIFYCDGCGCECSEDGKILGNEIFCQTCLNAEL